MLSENVCSCSRAQMLGDMGAALDWLSGLQTRHGWRTTKLVFGPMWYQLVCLHPEAAKVALRSGTYLTSCDSGQ